MLKIIDFALEHTSDYQITDKRHPQFSYIVDSDLNDTLIIEAILEIDGFKQSFNELNQLTLEKELKPLTEYKAILIVKDNFNNEVSKDLYFATGFFSIPWEAKWITDKEYVFKEKKVSPQVLVFNKNIKISKKVKSINVYSTCIGTYNVYVNSTKINDNYFAPGFTTYKKHLMYQKYDLKKFVKDDFDLNVVVAGGWAVGSYIFTRQNRITANKQALLLEVHIEYIDGTKEKIVTDSSWKVTHSSMYLQADLYDGEIYDSNKDFSNLEYHSASEEKLKIKPQLIADYSDKVLLQETFFPVDSWEINNKKYYDFSQNLAGIIHLKIKNAKKGQKITIRHSEILNKDKTLNTSLLRSAKCEIVYICKDGDQEYIPSFTYMGYRYIEVEAENIDYKVVSIALYSNIKQRGNFTCSNPLVNQLQNNIIWSSKSNFVEIPTDCPQRDERMGWTGDLAIFSPTAEFNFNITRFTKKWLKDLVVEQLSTGGIPNTIPSQGYGFPTTMPKMAVEFWGDSCILIPYNHYLISGDTELLKTMYPTMKKYVNACLFWAHLFSFGQNRYIWQTPSLFHFGDWVAPDSNLMSTWQKRSKYTATASLKNTSELLSTIAKILGNEKDCLHYLEISKKVSNAYINKFTNKNGKLKEEFQTAYVLPLHFKMFTEETRLKASENLATLIKKNDYCIGTGFPGTPFILFALVENNQIDTAFKMLENTKCPSWLYEVKQGATTIWEKYDALDEEGQLRVHEDGTGGMVSFNHYAFGAVGDFLYKKIAGINSLTPGYKESLIKPLIGGSFTSCSASTITPFGTISSSWKIENNEFTIEVKVPISTTCKLILPSGKEHILNNGTYLFKEKYSN